MTRASYSKTHTVSAPFAPIPLQRFTHCIHASLYQGKLHECGKPTENGAQRCTEHRACGPQGSRFHGVKTIRAIA